MTDTPGTLPVEPVPVVGNIHNYGGDNYVVIRFDPGSFICIGSDAEWTDAVAFTDHVGPGETATIEYVMSAAEFLANYGEGAIDEGAGPPQVDNELPPEAGTKPVEPDEGPEPEPKG